MSAIATLKTILGMDTAAYKAGAKDAAAATTRLQATITAAGRSLAAAFSVGAVMAGARKVMEWCDNVSTAAQNAGVLTKEMMALNQVAAANNLDIGDMQKLLSKTQNELYAAAKGSDESAKKFTDLGLSINDMIGMDPAGQLQAIAKAAVDSGIPLEALSTFFGEKLGPNAVAACQQIAQEGLPQVSDAAAAAADKVGALSDKFSVLKEKVMGVVAAAAVWTAHKVEQAGTFLGGVSATGTIRGGLNALSAESAANKSDNSRALSIAATQKELKRIADKTAEDKKIAAANWSEYNDRMKAIEDEKKAKKWRMAVSDTMDPFRENAARLREQQKSILMQGGGSGTNSTSQATGSLVGAGRGGLAIADRQLRLQIEANAINRQIAENSAKMYGAMEELAAKWNNGDP